MSKRSFRYSSDQQMGKSRGGEWSHSQEADSTERGDDFVRRSKGGTRVEGASSKSPISAEATYDSSDDEGLGGHGTGSKSQLSVIQEDLAASRTVPRSTKVRAKRSKSEHSFTTRRHVKKRQPPPMRPLYNNVNASLLSVLSSLTAITNTSGSSNSTLTQQSYNREMAKHRQTRGDGSRSHLVEPVVDGTPSTRGHSRQVSVKDVDDDAYSELMKESQNISTSSSTEYDSSVLPSTPTSNPGNQLPSDHDRLKRSAYDAVHHHTIDAAFRGASGGYCSPGQDVHSSYHGEATMSRSSQGPTGQSDGTQHLHTDSQHQTIRPTGEHLTQCATVPHISALSDPPHLSQTTLIGYEQLAIELTRPGAAVKPIYRTFSHLNHRILLHLQDQLAELEEQLREVDELIARYTPVIDVRGHHDGGSASRGARRMPSTRRGDVLQPAPLLWEREQLLGRIYHKVEQYSTYLQISKGSRL